MDLKNGQTKHKERIKSLEIALRQIIQDKNNEIDLMKKAFLNLNDKSNSILLENSSKPPFSSDLLQIIDQKSLEITNLRTELTDTIHRYNNKILQEDANKQAIDGLLSNYSSEIHLEREKYKMEIKHLKELLDDNIKKNNELKQENQILMSSYNQRIEEIQALTRLFHEDVNKNQKIEDYSKTIIDQQSQINECERNNKIFQSKIYENEKRLSEQLIKIQELNQKIKDLQINLEEYQIKLHDNHLKLQQSNSLKENSEKKLEEYLLRINENQKEIKSLENSQVNFLKETTINKETYDQMIRTLSDTVTNQCDDIYNLMQINEKYEFILKEKEFEFNSVKEEFNKRTLEISQEYEILQRKAIMSPKDLEVKFQAERTSYTTDITQMRRKIKDYEVRLTRLTEENEKLNELSVARQKEILKWKAKGSNTLINKEEYERLKVNVEALKVEIIELKEKNMKINSEKNNLQIKLQKILKDNENTQQELKDSYEIIANIKENYQNNKEISGMNSKINSLNQRNKSLEEDLMYNKEKSEKFEQENYKLTNEIIILKEQLNKKEQEYYQKTKEFNDEITILNELHKKYDRAINTFESENRISVLKKSIILKDL